MEDKRKRYKFSIKYLQISYPTFYLDKRADEFNNVHKAD